MNHVSKLTAKFSNWFGNEAEKTESPLLLQSLEDRVLYSAVPLPVETVDVPVDSTDVDDVEFAEIQSNATFVFVDDTAESSAGDSNIQWEPGDFDTIGTVDATLEDLEQLINSIEGTESDLTDDAEPAVARSLAEAIENNVSPNNFAFDEGQSFQINEQFFSNSEVDFENGFILIDGTSFGTLYRASQIDIGPIDDAEILEPGDTITRDDIVNNRITYVPDADFVGTETIDIRATSDLQKRQFVFVYSGVSDDGIIVVGDAFTQDEPAVPVFQATSPDSETQVQALSDGYVVVSVLGDGQNDLQFQIFDNDGVAIDAPVEVNGGRESASDIEVTSLDDGGFLILYRATIDQQDIGVVARYNSLGEFIPFGAGNDLTAANVDQVSIANLGEDRFAISFVVNDEATVRTQVFNLDDADIENSSFAEVDVPLPAYSTRTVTLPSGGFAVSTLTWDGNSGGISVTYFDPAGNQISSNPAINGLISAPDEIELIALPGDRAIAFVNSSEGITAFTFNPDGTSSVNSISVDGPVVDTTPQAVVLPDGSFILSYNRIGQNGPEVIGQRYDQNLTPLFDEFVITSVGTDNPQNTDLALLSDGTLISTFNTGDEDSVEIVQQQLVSSAKGDFNDWIPLNTVIDVTSTTSTEVVFLVEISGLPVGSQITAGLLSADTGEPIVHEVFSQNEVLFLNVLDLADGNLEFRAPENTSGIFDGTIRVRTTDGTSPEENGQFVSDFRVEVGPNPNNSQPPVFVGASNFPVFEGDTQVAQIMANDPNGDDVTFSLGLGNDRNFFQINPTTGDLQFQTPPDFESQDSISRNQIYSVTVIATGPNGTSQQEVTVNLLDRNDAPILDLLDENGAPIFTTFIEIDEDSSFVANIATSDQDGDVVDVNILSQADGGAPDGGFFEIENGQLSFITSPNFEQPMSAAGNNTYVLTLEADDGEGGFDRETITVDVQNIGKNEIPEFGGPFTFHVAEGETDSFLLNVTDREGDEITFSIDESIGDFNLFTVSADGLLEFNTPQNFDSTGDNQYDVFVVASDGQPQSTTQRFSVIIDSVNNAPVIEPVGTVPVMENERVVTPIDVSDPDGDDVTLSITGANEGIFEIDENNNLVFINPPDFDSQQSQDIDNSYVVDILAEDGNGGEDTIQIRVNVTDDNERPFYVGTDENRVLFQNENTVVNHDLTGFFEDPENDELSFDIVGGSDADLFTIVGNNLVLREGFQIDGAGPRDLSVVVVASDGENNSEFETLTVQIANQNDAPVITLVEDTNVMENERVVTPIDASDLDGDDVTLSVIGANEGIFEIDANNNLVFINPPDFDSQQSQDIGNSYDVDILAEDGNGGEDTIQIRVNVTDDNERPFHVGTDEDRVLLQNENTVVNHDLIGFFEDPENDQLSFDIVGGSDADLFTIVGDDLVLREGFQIDGAGSRNLSVVVVASDGENNSEFETFTVQINNINNAPVLVTPPQTETITLFASNSAPLFQLTATDQDADVVTYKVAGTSASVFAFDNDGQLRFTGNDADFENLVGNPTEIQIRATDGALFSETRSIVINANDLPPGQVSFNDLTVLDDNNSSGNDETFETSGDELTESLILEDEVSGNRVNVISNTAANTPLQQVVTVSGIDITGPTVISAVSESKIDDDESFLATLSDSVAYVYRSDSSGPQLISQEVGDVVTRHRSGEESRLEDSFLAEYFWQGFDKSEDDYISKNFDLNRTDLAIASAGLSLGLFSYFRVAAAMATTVATQLPAWKTLDVASLITAFDETEAETIHQIVDE